MGPVLRSELQSLALSGIRLEADGALSEALTTARARELVSRLEARGVEASWAPDNDDRTLAWVYVTEPQ